MILFASEAYRGMAAALQQSAGAAPGLYCVTRFDNGELHLRLRTTVAREHCVILGSLAPPDDRMLAALLLAHTLRRKARGA